MAKCITCGASFVASEWPKNRQRCDKCSLHASSRRGPASEEAARRARAEVCPDCGKALKSSMTLLHCVDRTGCGWEVIVKAPTQAPAPPAPAKAPAVKAALPPPPLTRARQRRAEEARAAPPPAPAPPQAEIDSAALGRAILERLRSKPRSLTDLSKVMRVDRDRVLGVLRVLRMRGTVGYTELRGWYIVGLDGPATIEDDMVTLPFVKGLIARLSDRDLAALGAWMEPHARALKAKHEMDLAADRVVDAMRRSVAATTGGPLSPARQDG